MLRFSAPVWRALAQWDDPAFLGVVARSLAASGLIFAGIALAAGYGLHHLWPGGGVFAGLLGGAGAMLAAIWLFLPLAMLIASLMLEPVAAAVERRYYPFLPPPRPAPLWTQIWDGLALGGLVLAASGLGVMLLVLLPGLGALLFWAIAAWAVGRGLFVAAAMRRMERGAAIALYRRQRLAVLAQGALLALAGTVPLLNLAVPVLGAAIMVHAVQLGMPGNQERLPTR